MTLGLTDHQSHIAAMDVRHSHCCCLQQFCPPGSTTYRMRQAPASALLPVRQAPTSQSLPGRNIIRLKVIVAPVAARLLPHVVFHCGSLNVTHICGSYGYPCRRRVVCCWFSWQPQPIVVVVAAKTVQLLHLSRMPLGSKLQCSLTAGVPSPCFSQKLRTNFARELILSRVSHVHRQTDAGKREPKVHTAPA
eukprot:SM000198S05337  [mRNA]  locus=s198:179382:183156:- [translate_table: standard]